MKIIIKYLEDKVKELKKLTGEFVKCAGCDEDGSEHNGLCHDCWLQETIDYN